MRLGAEGRIPANTNSNNPGGRTGCGAGSVDQGGGNRKDLPACLRCGSKAYVRACGSHASNVP